MPDRTTVVFVTVCTKDHRCWLADEAIHSTLCQVWTQVCGWLVGPYLLMPDHMHFFACRGDMDCSLERWQHYWKHQLSVKLADPTLCLQIEHWDTRMRNSRHFTETWTYVQQNPVRKGLVATPEEWPYQGIIHPWTYIGP